MRTVSATRIRTLNPRTSPKEIDLALDLSGFPIPVVAPSVLNSNTPPVPLSNVLEAVVSSEEIAANDILAPSDMKGIYELKKDKLVYCFAKAGFPRPTKFAVKPGSGHTLVKLERFSTGEEDLEKWLARFKRINVRKDEIGWIQSVIAYRCDSADELAEKLTAAKKLRTLWIKQGDLTDEGAAKLKSHTELNSLSIVSNQLTDAGVSELSGLKELTNLTLSCPNLTETSLAHVAEMPNLYSLDVSGTQVSDAGLLHLTSLTRLGDLRLNQTRVTDKGLSQLQHQPNLSTLFLANTAVTDAGIISMGDLSNLDSLNLEGTRITDAALQPFASGSKLTWLNLNYTAITDEGIAAISGQSELRTLHIAKTGVTDAGLRMIAKSFPKLTNLRAAGVEVSFETMQELIKLPELQDIFVSKGLFTDEEIQQLNASKPDRLYIKQVAQNFVERR